MGTTAPARSAGRGQIALRPKGKSLDAKSGRPTWEGEVGETNQREDR